MSQSDGAIWATAYLGAAGQIACHAELGAVLGSQGRQAAVREGVALHAGSVGRILFGERREH